MRGGVEGLIRDVVGVMEAIDGVEGVKDGEEGLMECVKGETVKDVKGRC